MLILATLLCTNAQRWPMARYPEWSDLRYFLELARTGKLAATARRLGVEHTTVARRIARLEEELASTLFNRRRDGYSLTEAGEALVPHAEAMEAAVLVAMSERGMQTGGATGVVRIGTPEAFGLCVVAPQLGKLYAEHPDLQVELLPLPHFPSLAAREVDILVTLNRPTVGRYVVSRLTTLEYHLYGSAEYLAKHAPISEPDQLVGHDFIDYVQDQLMSDELRYLERLTPQPRCLFTCTSILAQCEAISAGLGLGMLVPYIAEGRNDLVRVLPGRAKIVLTLWIAVPTDLFRLRRVRAGWDFLRKIVEAEPNRFQYL